MTTETEPLHRQLRRAIEESSMSWRVAAQESGIPKATLRRACDIGGASMPVSRVLAIARALGRPAVELLPDLEDMRVGVAETPDVILALSLDDAILVAGAAGLSLAELVPELMEPDD